MQIVNKCAASGVPLIFALSRSDLSHALGKSGHISCVGVLSDPETDPGVDIVVAATQE